MNKVINKELKFIFYLEIISCCVIIISIILEMFFSNIVIEILMIIALLGTIVGILYKRWLNKQYKQVEAFMKILIKVRKGEIIGISEQELLQGLSKKQQEIYENFEVTT